MDLLAVLILLVIGVWIAVAVRSAKKHKCSGCSSCCGGCTGCSGRKE